ncbi:MAG: SDR family oxidoreductase [Gammaproteobacteria bacterium]|nr:SDR family oxidoreductase [Gammaproteobacteria bacterium]
MDLSGKVCLVTGASRGIGAAIAERFAAAGATIVIHYGSDRDAAEAVSCRLPGDSHVVLGTDLSLPDNAAAFINHVMNKVDRLDVLVNNAGIYSKHPLLATGRDEWLEAWTKTLAVNLVSPAVLCHAAAKVMARQGGGRIINIGSRGAFRGEPDCPAYGASKAGLHAMSQSLAVALGPANIQVFAIAPGFTETDMISDLLGSDEGALIKAQSPLNRVARPAEIAETACFLAATEAEFLTGGIFDVNGASYLRS